MEGLWPSDFISDRCIPLEFPISPSIKVTNLGFQVEESLTWMDKIVIYLQDGALPKDKLHARCIQSRFARFCILNGVLYKKSFSRPFLKCFRPDEGEYVLKEIHEDIYENHFGARSLARKVIRQGYFWPNLERDAAAYIWKYNKYQIFAPISHFPPPHTHKNGADNNPFALCPLPFAQWGIDILGPLPQASLQI